MAKSKTESEEESAFANVSRVISEHPEPVKRDILNMLTRSFNLQDMCLVAVVRDIDFFVYNKTIPPKHVAVLFRAYLDDFFSKHDLLRGTLYEECVLWFLNPHAKKVTVPYFLSGRVLRQLINIGSGITSLNLARSEATNYELNSIVSYIPHVVNLDLSSTSCSNETLIYIQNYCPHLESLNISHCWEVTNYGMENLYLGKLTLRSLDITYCGVDVFGLVSVLDCMPSLECVKHIDLVYFVCYVDAKKQFNLTELIFNNRQPLLIKPDLEIIKALVKMCPKLKKLHFQHSVGVNVLNICAEFQNLEEIKIKMSHSGVSGLYDILTPIFPLSENLKTLSLSCARICPVKLLQCFRNLENLYLKHVSFTPFEKEDVKITKSNLLTLVMKNIAMETTNYEAVVLLISLSNDVTKLYLKYIEKLPPEIFDVIITSMKKLTLVNFDCTRVDVQYIYPFLEIPTLETIVMDDANTTVGLFEKCISCTLAWRSIRDSHYSDEISIGPIDQYYRGKRYCYFKNEGDENDIVSDNCLSSDDSD